MKPVLLHQTAQARPVAPIKILLQTKRYVVGKLEEIGDVIANAHIDLLPEIDVMRVKRVVEIEHPGFNGGKTASGVIRRSEVFDL